MRGWNGSLRVDGDAVVIERGLRGLLLGRGLTGTRRISLGEIKGIWFCRGQGRRLVGYVHLVTAGPQPASNDYVACVRDRATVTFLGDAATWLALASRIAALSGVVLEELPVPDGSAVVRRLAGARRNDDLRF